MPLDNIYDLLIVGGGINGAAVARAAAVAGHRVLLVERDDLAQWTSSASTRLIHGGLRYLEHYEFRLVRESLAERSILLRAAPHLVRPLEFRLPHVPSMRPWVLVRAGLWLYDLFALEWDAKKWFRFFANNPTTTKTLGGLPRSRSIRIDDPLLKDKARGFSYWDARTDDARLVLHYARDAADAGADIRPRTALVSATRDGPLWSAKLSTGTVQARAIVNAAGAWVEDVLRDRLGRAGMAHARLVRGGHLVVRRTQASDNAWLLQQPDGRVVFAIPWPDGLMLIGTTDVPAAGPDETIVTDAETDYLLAAANRFFAVPLARADIVSTYAGIRALFDDGKADASAVTRDYRLELDSDGPPLLSIFGGKLTTARRLADAVLEKLGMRAGETRHRALPGGDMVSLERFTAEAGRRWSFLPSTTLDRLALAYGTRMERIVGGANRLEDLGRDFGYGLTEREVTYLIDQEWAVTADDILRRRTGLGIWFSDEQRQALTGWLERGRG